MADGVLWEHEAPGSSPGSPTRGENSLSQDERTAHIFSRSTNWQGGTHESELQRGYELFKLIQLGGVNHLNAEMAEWQTHLTQNQASIPHVGSSPTFGTNLKTVSATI